MSAREKRSHLLTVSGFVAAGQLHLDWTYSEKSYRRSTIERLVECYRQSLRDLTHPLVAGGLLQQPPGEVEPVQDRHGRAREREPDGVIYEEVHGPPVLPPVTK